MNPPPPRFPASGFTTASAKWVATAASTAFPPRRRTSTPTAVATESVVATIPSRPSTVEVDCAGKAHPVGATKPGPPIWLSLSPVIPAHPPAPARLNTTVHRRHTANPLVIRYLFRTARVD